jgi:uncharacterized protein
MRGGGMILPIASRFGWKGILIGLAIMFIMGGGLKAFLGGSSTKEEEDTTMHPKSEMDDFVAFLASDNQNVWQQKFSEMGKPYEPAYVVLFTGATRSGCGTGTSEVGPFYCPLDQRVYIDLSFYEELRRRFSAGGDFAQAYVLAHEFGHHVQKQLGLMRAEDRGTGAGSEAVRIELQADCFAGIWARTTNERNLLEAGDVDEAINAAKQIGDDKLQEKSTGRVQPEKWTHGSSEQRARWFKKGFDSGQVAACDTSGAL